MSMLYQNRQYLREKIATSREDKRSHTEFRPITIETGLLDKAEGSARVKIGESDVIVGVKMDIGTPFPDSPAEGVLMVNSEFSAIASPEFENGPPREDSIELSRVVDRGIRESKTIDVGKLCIEKGEKVWIVFADINIMNYDGNLIDAAGIATIAALMSTKVPKIEKDGTINRDASEGSLPVTEIPVPVSVGNINGTIVLDMTKKEEKCADAVMTITTKKDGNFCAMQKAGPSALTEEQILKIADLSKKEGAKIRSMIEKAVKANKN